MGINKTTVFGCFYATILVMNESQPAQPYTHILEGVEEELKKPETEIPYVFAMEKKEIMDLFRGDNPGNPETKRLVTLWMDEARQSVEGIEADSPVRESMLRAAQENLFTVANLAKWDRAVDPEALVKYDAWQVKLNEWVTEDDAIFPKNPVDVQKLLGVHDSREQDILFITMSAKRQRRQMLLEIARADVYLSVGDEEEAYNCLDQAIDIYLTSSYFDEETKEPKIHETNLDLVAIAKEKITAITKVLNFLNANAKKPE